MGDEGASCEVRLGSKKSARPVAHFRLFCKAKPRGTARRQFLAYRLFDGRRTELEDGSFNGFLVLLEIQLHKRRYHDYSLGTRGGTPTQ